MSASRELHTSSPEETIAAGRQLARQLAPGQMIILRGDLGAGKTTLTKGIAEGFAAAREEDVTSPTFTLVHEYRGPEVTLFHIDLYRLETEREIDAAGLEEYLTPDGVTVIEWAERLSEIPAGALRVEIEYLSDTERRIRVAPAQ